MQTILFQRNKIWYVILRYIDINGLRKEKRISTHCEKKSEAQQKVGDIVIQYAGLESSSATYDMLACDFLPDGKKNKKGVFSNQHTKVMILISESI